MFENAGSKLIKFAKVFAWVGIIVSWLIGFSRLFSDDPAKTFLPFLFIGGLGSLASWISGLCLCAFGEIAEKASRIGEYLSSKE